MTGKQQILILGAGMTGLSAGLVSQAPVYEKSNNPGGICLSYYVEPGAKESLAEPPTNDEAYRFDNGGGHWIFGGDSAVLRSLHSLAPSRRYARRSSVFFAARDLYVPYPLQNHLGVLGAELAARALDEISTAPRKTPVTMAEWINQALGGTLTDLFFGPFHELYTAGLWKEIAPQDAYKSPVNLSLVLKGAFAPGYGPIMRIPTSFQVRLCQIGRLSSNGRACNDFLAIRLLNLIN